MRTLYWNDRMGRAVFFVVSVIALASTAALAQENFWINPTSGNWDDASSWSLGILPNSSQSVFIENSGWKAVAINPSTPTNSPDSMTVNSLTIIGSTNTENTLLLNYFGTAVPLTVLNGITLQNYAQLLNFNSGLVVEGGAINVTNSQINQDGGLIQARTVTMDLEDAEYNLTNGDFEGGTVYLGTAVSATFNQYGGTATISDLEFGRGSSSASGNYALYGGNLSLPNGLTIFGDYGATSSYFQSGGTNQTTFVTLEPGISGASPSFTLNGGLLADDSIMLDADNFGGITVSQGGGTHVVTNALNVAGGAASSTEPHLALYSLTGGTLTAGSMNLDATSGPASFNESNGNAQVGTIQAHTGSVNESYFVTSISLSGGTLSCSNLSVTGGGTINQSGGSLAVSSSLSFGGYLQTGPAIYRQYSQYQLNAGTLFAKDIFVGGTWVIGDSAGAIVNTGTVTLSHTLQIGNAPEQLGQLILAGTSVIDLAGSASQLSFENSSEETWATGATLEISGWNGNPDGGGAEQLKFGTDQSGLTQAELNQTRFLIGTNLYSAKILSTGEVVPDQVVSAPVNFAKQGNNFILNWLPGYTLQSSTNVAGPYANALDQSFPAVSPYTNNTTGVTQEFFKVVVN